MGLDRSAFARASVLPAIVTVVFLASGAAQAASCFSGSNVVDPAKVEADKTAIKGDPVRWFGSRGGNLAKAVRDVTASDPDFAKTMVDQAHVAKQGSGAAGNTQSSAVGSGLGQAAIACLSHPDDAAKIQSAAAASPDNLLVVSFSSTTGNTEIAATGGGAGGDGGGGTGNGGTVGLGTTPDGLDRRHA